MIRKVILKVTCKGYSKKFREVPGIEKDDLSICRLKRDVIVISKLEF